MVSAGSHVEGRFAPAAGGASVLPAVTLALGLLGAAGLSVGLFFMATSLAPTFSGFVEYNFLERGDRNTMAIAAGGCAVVPMAWALRLLRRRGRAAVGTVVRASRLAAPLVLLLAVPVLFAYRTWAAHPLPFLVLLTGFTVLAESLVKGALVAMPGALVRHAGALGRRVSPRAKRALPLAIVGAAAVAYSVFATYFTILSHRRLATGGFDLGLYDNLMFNALHGHPFRSPVLLGPGDGLSLSNHSEFAMLLFLPLYAVHPGPGALLVLQGALFGMAAVPLYLFASTLLPRASAAVVALLYLLYAPLHGPNFYDFHWLPCAIFFEFWLFYAIARNKPRQILVMLAILFLIREDIAVCMAALGLFLLATGARPKLGLGMFVSSVVWFAVDKFGIMRLAGSWWFADMYRELSVPGEEGYGSVIKTLIVNPYYFVSTLVREAKLTYALHLFAPLAFLPARRLALLLLASPGFFFTLMTTSYGPPLSISFQYTSYWVPFLFAASVLALMLIGRDAPVSGHQPGHAAAGRRAALSAMTLGVVMHSFVFGAILQHQTFTGGFALISFSMSDEEKGREADLERILTRIPERASVAATESECPHISTRLDAYTLMLHHGDADYLLINRRNAHIQGTGAQITEAFTKNDYGLVAREGDLYLFARDAVSPGTEAAYASLGLGPLPKPVAP